MSNNTEALKTVKCIKDTEGYWTEGESYPFSNDYNFILVGDDEEPHGNGWAASAAEFREDGAIVYQIYGIDGEVLFEGASND